MFKLLSLMKKIERGWDILLRVFLVCLITNNDLTSGRRVVISIGVQHGT